MSLSLARFVVGPLQENCYLLFDEKSKEAVFVDPGEEAPLLLEAIEQKQLKLEAIWLTHAHFDHIGAVEAISKAHQAPIFLHPQDVLLYQNAFKVAKLWDIPFTQPSASTHDLDDGQILRLGTTEVHCLFTPGHAPGHIAFYLPGQSLVLAGDTLFRGSVGRTDLPGGNPQQLFESIRSKLLSLPDDTVVYPGHGPETSIGIEKIHNPYVQ